MEKSASRGRKTDQTPDFAVLLRPQLLGLIFGGKSGFLSEALMRYKNWSKLPLVSARRP